MSRLTTALQNDLKLLALMHDELALQAHLLKADMKGRWQELEAKWAELKAQAARAEVAGEDAVHESETAIGLLVEALRKGYENIRSALRS